MTILGLEEQVPADGIMQTNDWGTSKVYSVACGCGQSDHSHNVWIEADDMITVTIYTTSRSDTWSKSRWYHIWTLLTKGYIDTESVIHLSNQQAYNYANTLLCAISDVNERKQTIEEEKKPKTRKKNNEQN